MQLAGFEPDVVVVADKSRPPFVLGIEKFPCFTVFYAVDTHIHSWYPYYAQVFDACLVSLKDHVSLFHGKSLKEEHVRWSPAFAKDTDTPRPEITPHWDCLFVGTINPETTPKRQAFLKQLQEHTSVHCTRGNYVELYPQGKVILNHCEHGDLNFRVFEALGCGACLVTPRIEHGLTELFTHSKELFYYDINDKNTALDGIRWLLSHENLRKDMATCGLEAIDKGHRALHRAQSFTDFFENLSSTYIQDCINKRRNNADALRNIWLKPLFLLLAEAMTQEELRTTYLQASRGIF